MITVRCQSGTSGQAKRNVSPRLVPVPKDVIVHEWLPLGGRCAVHGVKHAYMKHVVWLKPVSCVNTFLMDPVRTAGSWRESYLGTWDTLFDGLGGSRLQLVTYSKRNIQRPFKDPEPDACALSRIDDLGPIINPE